MTTLDVITVRQPWAWAIMHAGKDVENRCWVPPARVFGARIGIHAAIMDGSPASKIRYRRDAAAIKSSLVPGVLAVPPYDDVLGDAGALLGTVRLIGVVTEPFESEWANPDSRYYWLLRAPELLESPLRIPGHQRFWKMVIPC